ncbi:unnamed protein product [Trifolium pratense]|uniref:Uncharacterized protein n=1 Tax=Trifolium pratense TaxID=57577 RepID=A0ACB0LAE5_TRIPR|nr:unnamed protein product [Trifolium pratense]
MPKNVKIVPIIILFVILFLIIEEVASNSNDPYETIPTSQECKSTQDCPDLVTVPNCIFSFCIDGYCHKFAFNWEGAE